MIEIFYSQNCFKTICGKIKKSITHQPVTQRLSCNLLQLPANTLHPDRNPGLKKQDKTLCALDVSSHIKCESLDRCVSQEEFQWILVSSHIEKNIKVINLRYLFFVISGNISSRYMLDYMHFPVTQNQI